MFVAQEPFSYEEAVRGKDSGKCQAAIVDETEAFRGHKTWTTVDPSAVKQSSIDHKWVYKARPETNATIADIKHAWLAKLFKNAKGSILMKIMHPLPKWR